MKVKSKRSSAGKSIVWRLMGIVVKAAVTFAFTRSLPTTALVTIIHHATFLPVFYLHERGWYKVTRKLGKFRNIFKAFTYEIILGMGLGGLIIYIVDPTSTTIWDQTLTYTAIKLVMYYFYDRIWK